MRERVEKGATGLVLVEVNLRGDGVGVVVGQYAVDAKKTHEGRREADAAQLPVVQRRLQGAVAVDRTVGVDGQRFNLAGRKTQRDAVLETQHGVQRPTVRRRAAPQPQVDDAHRLEELEALRLIDQVADQTRLTAPLRGWHRSSSFPLACDRTVSCEKLFRCTYRPKKWSRTCANRCRPVPAKASSSSVTRTSMPCTRLLLPLMRIQVRAAWWSSAVMPAIWRCETDDCVRS